MYSSLKTPAFIFGQYKAYRIRTRSEQEPPEQYSMMIHRREPFKYEP